MIAPSPDSRRRLSIDSNILANTQNKQKRQSGSASVTIIPSDDESVVGGDVTPSETVGSSESSPVVKRSKKKKAKGKGKSAQGKDVSSFKSFN
jgi:hypothetical protein